MTDPNVNEEQEQMQVEQPEGPEQTPEPEVAEPQPEEPVESVEPLLEREPAERILLALLFVSDSPVPVEKMVPVFESEVGQSPRGDEQRAQLEERLSNEIRGIMEGLAASLLEDDGPFQIAEVAGGFQLCTKEDLASYIDRFFERRKKSTLSGAALETLAIIAYQQPITRAELEAMRGVNVDHMVHSLLEKRLIRVAGRKDVPGKPFMYRSTKFFLEYFGLSSLQELPKADELREALERGTDPERQANVADVGFKESEDDGEFAPVFEDEGTSDDSEETQTDETVPEEEPSVQE